MLSDNLAMFKCSARVHLRMTIYELRLFFSATEPVSTAGQRDDLKKIWRIAPELITHPLAEKPLNLLRLPEVISGSGAGTRPQINRDA